MYFDASQTGNTQQTLRLMGVASSVHKRDIFFLGASSCRRERHYYNGTAVLEGFLADADY